MTISFDFEAEDLTKERVQELIWNEIRDFHPRIPAVFPSSSRGEKEEREESKSSDAKAESKTHHSDEKSLSRKRSISPSSK